MTSLENERSQPVGIKAAWPLSKPPEQLTNVDAVLIEGHISGAAQSTHPLTEGRQESGIVNRSLGSVQSDDPGILQVGQEQARAMYHSQLLRMAVMWATAPTEVTVEARQRLLVQLAHPRAMPMGPIDEVFRRSKMSTSGNGSVARLR
jgi:hypothetical protein